MGWLMGSLLIDAIFVTLSYFGSYLLRFEGAIPYYMISGVWYALPIFVSVKLFFFYYFGLYRALWRYTGIVDVMNIVKGATAASITIMLIILFFFRFWLFSRAVYLIDWGLTILLISGVRAAFRMYMNSRFYAPAVTDDITPAPKKRLLIIGAGAAAEKVVRELRENKKCPPGTRGLPR